MSRYRGYTPLPDEASSYEPAFDLHGSWGPDKRTEDDPPTGRVLLAASMLFFGLLIFSLGLLIRLERWDNRVPGSSTAYMMLGALLIVPGGYASTVALGTYLRWRGFSYSQMPQLPRT